MIKEKTKAPLFKLPSTEKSEFNLKDTLGSFVIIYFYPKDDTPGCTIETNDFNKLLPKFNKLNCKVLGISKDNISKLYPLNPITAFLISAISKSNLMIAAEP